MFALADAWRAMYRNRLRGGCDEAGHQSSLSDGDVASCLSVIGAVQCSVGVVARRSSSDPAKSNRNPGVCDLVPRHVPDLCPQGAGASHYQPPAVSNYGQNFLPVTKIMMTDDEGCCFVVWDSVFVKLLLVFLEKLRSIVVGHLVAYYY